MTDDKTGDDKIASVTQITDAKTRRGATQVDKLMSLCGQLKRTDKGATFAEIEDGNITKTVSTSSAVYRKWLQIEYTDKHGTAPSRSSVTSALELIESRAARRGVAYTPPPTIGDDGADDGSKEQADLIIAIARRHGVSPYHTRDGRVFVDVTTNGQRKTMDVESKDFFRFLTGAYYRYTKEAPAPDAVRSASKVFDAEGEHDGPERIVSLRIARHEESILLNLARPDGRVVEIHNNGYRIVTNPPGVRFESAPLARPLPLPDKAKDDDGLKQLRELFNLPEDDDDTWLLLLGWIVSTFWPEGPFPILSITGEQGAAKSTATKWARGIVDPCTAGMRSLPRKQEDLFIHADGSHILAFDNVSSIQPWLSDALCILSTGGGLGRRSLYQNRHETAFEAQKPVIINGITEFATRPDLLDRCVLVHLAAIPKTERKQPSVMTGDFEKALPGGRRPVHGGYAQSAT